MNRKEKSTDIGPDRASFWAQAPSQGDQDRDDRDNHLRRGLGLGSADGVDERRSGCCRLRRDGLRGGGKRRGGGHEFAGLK